jgi:hypothetical protein
MMPARITDRPEQKSQAKSRRSIKSDKIADTVCHDLISRDRRNSRRSPN